MFAYFIARNGCMGITGQDIHTPTRAPIRGV